MSFWKQKWLLRQLRHARKYNKPVPATEQFAFDQTVFLGYDPKALEMLQALRDKKAQPKPGYITDFIGARTRVTSLPKSTHDMANQVLGLPIPNDYLAEAAEWVALGTAVQDAAGSFHMMELGAGWGPWIVGGGHLARRAGISDIHLLGVEADDSHFATMQDHFRDNGFDPDAHTLLMGAAGTEDGTAQWAIPDDPSEAWGHRPVAADAAGDPDPADLHYKDDTIGARAMRDIQVFDVKKLVARQPFWNLIHIDIQGWEATVIADAIKVLDAHVHRLAIGTHSRQIEAALFDTLHGAGWVLEGEKPCQFTHRPEHRGFESMTTVDGFQCWRNPGLTP